MAADVWAPLRYGWSHVYWLTIEGIAHVWTERVVGKTLPTGYTSEVATLVVDGSAAVGAVIDRDTGIGAGFPLTATLLDSTELSALLRRPTAQTVITQDHTSSVATLTVASAADFAATGTAYIGRERVTYTGKTATTLTGCTRGTVGYAYPHDSRSGAATVTNAPRYWRGRLVTLYAVPITPAGHVTGSTLAADSVAIWQGYMAAEPSRRADGTGWDIDALPLDRMLARPLMGELVGELVDTEPRFQVTSDDLMLSLERLRNAAASDFYTIQLTPFADAGFAVGDWVGVSQFNAALKSSWSAAVTAHGLGAWLGAMIINQASAADAKPVASGPIDKGDWVPLIELKTSAATRGVKLSWWWFGGYGQQIDRYFGSPGVQTDLTVQTGVSYAWTPYNANVAGPASMLAPPHRGTVRFDQGDPGALPAKGLLSIGENTYSYKQVLQTTNAAIVQFAGLQPVGSTVALSSQVGATVRVVSTDEDVLADVVRRMLHSSGETGLRSATWDTLPGRVGYGLPESLVDDDGIGAVLGEGWLSSIDMQVSLSGASLADAVGGVMALAGLALVVSDEAQGDDAEIRAVHTSAAVAGGAVQLRDEHLICIPSPEVEVEAVEAPNTVTARLRTGDSTHHIVREVDVSRVADEGVVELEVDVPTADKAGTIPAIAGWALTRLVGDAQAVALRVDVVPWLAVRPGSAVDVSISHPAVWSWSTGATGYTGRARCIGRQVDLDTGVQTLHLLLDGLAVGTALCPAPAVTTWAGLATAPTTIDIPRAYYSIMSTALTQSGGLMRLLHYQPGQGAEGVTQAYNISAVTDTGTVCRLTVSSVIGGAVLTTSSYLTWPETANASPWQQRWMHDADGTRWL